MLDQIQFLFHTPAFGRNVLENALVKDVLAVKFAVVPFAAKSVPDAVCFSAITQGSYTKPLDQTLCTHSRYLI